MWTKGMVTNYHLFLQCLFTTQVWKEVRSQLGVAPMWTKGLVTDCFKDSFTGSTLKALRILPILALWGISNSGIFVNKVTPTFKVSQQALALLHH
jgi:hypothetical protein